MACLRWAEGSLTHTHQVMNTVPDTCKALNKYLLLLCWAQERFLFLPVMTASACEPDHLFLFLSFDVNNDTKLAPNNLTFLEYVDGITKKCVSCASYIYSL